MHYIICSIKWGVDVSLCSVLQDTNLHNTQVRETFPPHSYKLHRHSESFSQEMMKSLCVVKWRIQLTQEATHSLLSSWSPLSWFKDSTSLMLPAENAGFSLQMLHSTANKLNQHHKVLLFVISPRERSFTKLWNRSKVQFWASCCVWIKGREHWMHKPMTHYRSYKNCYCHLINNDICLDDSMVLLGVWRGKI